MSIDTPEPSLDKAKQQLNAAAWHGEEPYNADESIRLEMACDAFRHDAESLPAGEVYRLLDVGCGVGPLRRWLAEGRFHITGLDISEQAAEIARANYDECLVGDVEADWPFQQGSFHGVHAGAILEHVVDWNAPLNQANRCLRDRGVLVASVPNLRYWKEVRKLVMGKQPHWIRCMMHLHAYTPSFFRRLVEVHGFRVVTTEADRVNLPLFSNRSRWVRRRFASIGSVLVVTARLGQRVRIEDIARLGQFPEHRQVDKHFIEVPLK